MAGGLLLVLAGTAGCGSGSRNYALPAEICGRAVEPPALKPLLPEGEKFDAEQRSTEEISSDCAVSVDGRSVFWLVEYRDQGSFDVVEHAKEIKSARNPVKSDLVEGAIVSDGNFLLMRPCPARGQKSNYILDISMAGPSSDTEELRRALEEFAASYLPEGLRAMGCTE